MSDSSFTIRIKRRWVRIALVAAVFAMVMSTTVALASHVFDDVPTSNVFHDDITWLKNAGVTIGCNPPLNTNYCPDDPVTREQMSAFMRRLAENRVVDAGTFQGQAVGDFSQDLEWALATDAVTIGGKAQATINVECPGGKKAVSGGGASSAVPFVIASSVPTGSPATGWQVNYFNTGDNVVNGNITAYVLCARYIDKTPSPLPPAETAPTG